MNSFVAPLDRAYKKIGNVMVKRTVQMGVTRKAVVTLVSDKQILAVVRKNQRHVINAGTIVSECCTYIKVLPRDEQKTAPKLTQPNIFTTYMMEPDILNTRVHYTSQDGKYALTYITEPHGQWYLQSADKR